MKLLFRKVDTGFYRVETEKEHNGRKVFPCVATIEQRNDGRKLWQVNVCGKGVLQDRTGNDCFSLAIAKKELASAMNE